MSKLDKTSVTYVNSLLNCEFALGTLTGVGFADSAFLAAITPSFNQLFVTLLAVTGRNPKAKDKQEEKQQTTSSSQCVVGSLSKFLLRTSEALIVPLTVGVVTAPLSLALQNLAASVEVLSCSERKCTSGALTTAFLQLMSAVIGESTRVLQQPTDSSTTTPPFTASQRQAILASMNRIAQDLRRLADINGKCCCLGSAAMPLLQLASVLRCMLSPSTAPVVIATGNFLPLFASIDNITTAFLEGILAGLDALASCLICRLCKQQRSHCTVDAFALSQDINALLQALNAAGFRCA